MSEKETERIFEKENLPLTKCSEYEIFDNGIVSHFYDDYYCANFTNRSVMPLSQTKYRVFQINLYICPPEDLTYSFSNCTSFDYIQLNELKGEYVYFNYYRPTIYQQPDN